MRRNVFLRCFLPLFGGVLSLSSLAQSPATLVICHPGGTSTRVALYTYPKVKFSADSVLIISSVATYHFVVSSVKRLTYEGVWNGIPSIPGSAGVHIEGDCLLFDTTVPASSVRLFSSDGKALTVTLLERGGRRCLSLSSLPAGVYVCKAGHQTFKIAKP